MGFVAFSVSVHDVLCYNQRSFVRILVYIGSGFVWVLAKKIMYVKKRGYYLNIV